jgi:hypothetical protein
MLPSSHLSRFALLAAVCLAWPAAPAHAQADLKDPYHLRIVLHVARHPLLTEVFRQQLQRELKDGIQAALGKLARVDVVFKHPKLADVLAQGLAKGLDGWRERTGMKTHFVLVDFSGTRYEIQARQHDGITGLPGPAVRRERTRDRAYVAREAALLIRRDLGLVGTITSAPDAGGAVGVVLKGGGLGVDLGRWVKKGEVFSVVRMDGSGPGQEMAWTLLQVETPPTDGVCKCRLYCRFVDPQVIGARCVLLGTRPGTLRLRLVEEKPGGGFAELVGVAKVEIRKRSFEGEDTTLLSVLPNAGSDVVTAKFKEGRFDHMAFVSVESAGKIRRYPVPLIDDRVVVIPVVAGNFEDNQVLEHYKSLRRSLSISSQVQTDLFEEINKLTAKDETTQALARVREALDRSRADHTRLSKDRDNVAKELAKLPARERPSLAGIDRQLRKLRTAETDLRKHITLLEKINKDVADPDRKQARFDIEKAKQLEKEAEAEQALALYKKVPEKFWPQGLDKYIKKLEADLKPRSKEHAQAKDFIYKEWPRLDTQGLVKGITQAEKVFEVCKKLGDQVYPRKLLKETRRHMQRMEKELAGLKVGVNPDDDTQAKVLLELAPKIRKLENDVSSYLEKE